MLNMTSLPNRRLPALSWARSRAFAMGISMSVALTLLASCATLSKKECLSADWAELGREDGRAGQPAAWLDEHRQACAEHGVVPNEPAWFAGRAQGLADYCVLDRALSDGLAGRGYQGVCPGIDADFSRLNQAALQVHAARSVVLQLNLQASQLEQQLSNRATDEKRRAAIRNELAHLDRKQSYARDELRWRERDLDRLREGLRR